MKLLSDKSATRPGRSVYCRIGDVEVAVSSEVDDVLDDFAALYETRSACRETSNLTVRMEVKRTGRSAFGGSRYSICEGGDELFGERRMTEVLPYLEWGINWSVIKKCTTYLQLHAATMCYKGQGIILAGNSGDGKSTLAAGLITRGFTYLSDEFALIHPETLSLHPFPKALCIKSGSFETIKELNLPLWRRRHYVKALKGAVGYVRPSDFASGDAPQPCPIRYVVFPKYIAGEKPRLYSVSAGKTAFSLAAHSFNRDAFGSATVAILSRVVRGAKCVGLVSGPIEETCDLLLSQLLDT